MFLFGFLILRLSAKSNLNLCGSLVLLFSVFIKIVSMSTKLLYNCFVSLFDLHKECNNCLISFLSFSELFLGNLLRIWFCVKIFSADPFLEYSYKKWLIALTISNNLWMYLLSSSVSMSSLTSLFMFFNSLTTFSLSSSFVARSNSFIKLLKFLPLLYFLNSLSSMSPIYSSKMFLISSIFLFVAFFLLVLVFVFVAFAFLTILYCYHYLTD